MTNNTNIIPTNTSNIINITDLITLVNVTQKQDMTQNPDGSWLFKGIHESQWDMSEIYSLRDSMLKSSVMSGSNKSTLEYSLILIERDGEKIAIAKPYLKLNLLNPISKRTTLATRNKTVIRATKVISDAKRGQKYTTYAICRELANLNTKEILNELNFKNISSYAKAVFDLETATANQYARIGKNFISYDADTDTYYMRSSAIPQVSVSYLLELNALVENEDTDNPDISKVEELFLTSQLTESMSTSKVRKLVKSLKKAEEAIEGEATVTENEVKKNEVKENEAETPSTEVIKAEPIEEKVSSTEVTNPEATFTDTATPVKNAMKALTDALANYIKLNPTKKELQISWDELATIILTEIDA